MSTTISSTSFNDYYSQARSLKKNLGQSDFLQLMIAQLKNQDPTQPSNDLNQILQSATFGILDSVNAIRDAVADKNLNVFNYTNLVGKQITYTQSNTDPATNETTQTTKQSVVQGVSLQNGNITLQVDDGIVTPNQITQINFEGQDKKVLVQDTMAYFSMVGKKVDYTVDTPAGTSGTTIPTTKQGTIDSVTMKNGIIQFTVGSDQFTMDKITGVYNTMPSTTTLDQTSTASGSASSTDVTGASGTTTGSSATGGSVSNGTTDTTTAGSTTSTNTGSTSGPTS